MVDSEWHGEGVRSVIFQSKYSHRQTLVSTNAHTHRQQKHSKLSLFQYSLSTFATNSLIETTAKSAGASGARMKPFLSGIPGL